MSWTCKMLHLVFILATIIPINFISSQTCYKVDECSCKFDTGHASQKMDVAGGILDLHKIADGGEPIFFDPRKSGGEFFYYSPCIAYPCPTLKDSALCLTPATTGEKSQDLGDIKGMNFYTNITLKDRSPMVSLIYHTSSESNISSQVNLVCSEDNEFRYERKINDTAYLFSLYSPCACVNGCRDSLLSAGTILVLIFFSVLLVYFGVGCLYKKAVFGATGQEIIPNHQFWTSLPGLIKDGYIFFISPCLGDRAEYRVYDRL